MLSIRFAAGLFAICTWGCASVAAADQQYALTEPVAEQRVYHVDSSLTVTGHLETVVGPGKSQTLDLAVKARHLYLERRLSGTGRDAAALRSLRRYEQSVSAVKVDKQSTSSRLRGGRRSIVAQGRREGIEYYSPAGKLTRAELDLLNMPGDSLALLGLLPPDPVSVGQQWQPASWVIQMLTGTEALLKSELTCRLTSVKNGVARVEFSGSLEGAVVGAATEIELSGRLQYDLEKKFIRRAELTQKEERSVGAVSPGMKVEARVVMERAAARDPGPLTEAAANAVPLEPDPSLLLLVLETPWGVRLEHDRRWHVYHQAGDWAVLRLMENGSLIAQCDLRRVPAAAPGRHTPEQVFLSDIRKSLGDRIKEITMAEELKTADRRFLYRVTAVGRANDLDIHWISYLCAAPSGRQASLVFTVESKLLEQLDGRDIAMAQSLQFVPSGGAPPRAASGPR